MSLEVIVRRHDFCCCWCIISSSDRIEDLVVLGFPIHIKCTLESSSNKQTLLHIYPRAKNCQLLEQRFFRSSCWSDETNWTLLRAHPCICQNKWSFIWVVRFVLSILLSVGYRMHIVHTYMYCIYGKSNDELSAAFVQVASGSVVLAR